MTFKNKNDIPKTKQNFLYSKLYSSSLYPANGPRHQPCKYLFSMKYCLFKFRFQHLLASIQTEDNFFTIKWSCIIVGSAMNVTPLKSSALAFHNETSNSVP